MENKADTFFDVIGRTDLKGMLTPSSPWAYFSMEIGLPGFVFAGGLGILAGDLLLQAEVLHIPFVGVTLLYPTKWKQKLDHFSQKEEFENVSFDQLGVKREALLTHFANKDTVELTVYRKNLGSASLLALYEPGLKELYHGESNSDHRLYQQAVLGFGGKRALEMLGIHPSIIHLNESSTVFSALSFLDALCARNMKIEQALEKMRKRTILTNHTLLAGAVSTFTKDQYERYVVVNLSSPEVSQWLIDMVNQERGRLNISALALALSEKHNGVSKIHSYIAGREFRARDGSYIHFCPVANGVCMKRWIYEKFYSMYKERGIFDEFDLLREDYAHNVETLGTQEVKVVKQEAKEMLFKCLANRVNQYGESVHIPVFSKTVVWARRMVDYKRPTMLFENLKRLKSIIEKNNFYLIFSGSVHTGDSSMREAIRRILQIVSDDSFLSQRVHFVQEYDEELARSLVCGADVWLNTPEVGHEACGTSWMKAVANCTMLVSTEDGGVADVPNAGYLKIEGADYHSQVELLYTLLEEGGTILDQSDHWAEFVKRQLISYLPIVSVSRMARDYLHLVLPQYPLESF